MGISIDTQYNPLPYKGKTAVPAVNQPASSGEVVTDETAQNELQLPDPAENEGFLLSLTSAVQPKPERIKTDQDVKLEIFLKAVEKSNREIREAAERLKPLKVEPRPVPSALGLNVNSAMARLKRSELKVSGVVQEYNDRVPAGYVISQVPGPGASVGKKSGIRLVISKGPPPEAEKHDRVKKQEQVPIVRIKSRLDKDDSDEGSCAAADMASNILNASGDITL